MEKKMYMNVYTGSIGGFDTWWYINAEGVLVNAVSEGEVIEVVSVRGQFISVDELTDITEEE